MTILAMIVQLFMIMSVVRLICLKKWNLLDIRLSLYVIFHQFQTELRKILVSLIEVAQKLLALNPDAVELFKKANGKCMK